MDIIEKLKACGSCGQIQGIPGATEDSRIKCVRCGCAFPGPIDLKKSASRTAALALAALILFPVAIGLPIIRVERFGHKYESGLLEGCFKLLEDGHFWLSMLIFFCSIVLPVIKLTGLLAISTGKLLEKRHFLSKLWRFIEIAGKWGMLDVLLVALLAAIVKIGDLVEIRPGQGALIFTLCVLLSLASSAFFDPRIIWEDQPE